MNGNGNVIGRPRVMRRYALPPGCSVRTFVMRQLTGIEDLEAAIMADKTAPAAARESMGAAITVEQREKVRMALVEVDGKRVNGDTPYMALDHWNVRTIRFAERAYIELNGIQPEAMEDFLMGGQDVSEDDLVPRAAGGPRHPAAITAEPSED
jgi:hypothetical protein